MKKQIFEELKRELVNGHSKKGHPFRYFSLATIAKTNTSQQRTVVLRKTDSNLELLFYTDRRSSKIQQVQANKNVSCLFYHPKKLLQVKIEGIAKIVDDTKTLVSLWGGIPIKSRKDYTTTKAPSSLINNPDEVDYLNEGNHFCAVRIIPNKIEYLRLKRPNHLRVLFKKEDENWKDDFLVP